MIAGTLAAIGCCFHVIAFFYAGRSLDNDLELLTTPTRATAAIKKTLQRWLSAPNNSLTGPTQQLTVTKEGILFLCLAIPIQ